MHLGVIPSLIHFILARLRNLEFSTAHLINNPFAPWGLQLPSLIDTPAIGVLLSPSKVSPLGAYSFSSFQAITDSDSRVGALQVHTFLVPVPLAPVYLSAW